MSTKGFTLIELLVVVLIIGILASIAVPKYIKIIEKSRFTNVKTLAKQLGDAQNRYRETNGTHATTLEQLDITIKDAIASPYCAGLSVSDKMQDENFYYCIDIASPDIWKGTIAVVRKNGKYANTGFIWTQNRIYCIEAQNTNKMCKELLNGNFIQTSAGWDLFETN